MRTWEPPPPENPLPPLPDELAERPGIMWLYVCRQAGLTMRDLAHMRIDTAEALVELHEFVVGASADESTRSAEDDFWNL